MTPGEQKLLAIECGFNFPHGTLHTIMCSDENLAAYTAAVEAKERGRIAEIIDIFSKRKDDMAAVIARSIRSLK